MPGDRRTRSDSSSQLPRKQPGFLVGTKAEKLGTVRAGSRLACLMYESQIPMWSCVVRKGYGVATGVLLGHQHADFEKGGTDQVVGWVSMEGEYLRRKTGGRMI
jgi:propionyl-CoA carboxylase beta chain